MSRDFLFGRRAVPEASTIDVRGVAAALSGLHFAPGNGLYEDAKRRRLLLVGDGAGLWSFVHVDDAATATMAALRRTEAGIYNIVDDDPAPYREWVTRYIELLKARPPRHVPRWLARVVAGPAITSWTTDRPAASNAKAKRELNWNPSRRSWRQGFEELVSQS